NLKNRSVNFETGIDLVSKTKKGTITNKLIFQSIATDINANMFFNSELKDVPDTLIPAFSESGNYYSHSIKGSSSLGLNIFNLPFSASISYGIASVEIKEQDAGTKTTLPVFELYVGQKSKYSDWLIGDLSIRYSHHQPQQHELSEII